MFGWLTSPTKRGEGSTATRIAAARRARQPALVRLERSVAQISAALERTRAELEGIRSGRTAAPVMVASEATFLLPATSEVHQKLGGSAYLEMLCHREEGLEAMLQQLLGRLRAARAEAEALRDKDACTRRLVAILGRCRLAFADGQGVSLHAPQPDLQAEFEATVCSAHSREGRLLARWAELFEKQQQRRRGPDPPAGPSAAVVLDFVQYFARLVAAEHGVPQPRMAPVYVCSSRLLLSSLPPALWEEAVRRNAGRDARLLAQQRRLRRLSPLQLGVEPRFLAAASHPAATSDPAATPPPAAASATPAAPTPPLAAASVLADFPYLAVPVDMLLCLYRAVGLVHAAAAQAANVPAEGIGADALLPLLVWTVAHTPLPHGFAALDYVKALCTREQTTSELGYYLACLEAACEYVLDATGVPSPERPEEARGGGGGASPSLEGCPPPPPALCEPLSAAQMLAPPACRERGISEAYEQPACPAAGGGGGSSRASGSSSSAGQHAGGDAGLGLGSGCGGGGGGGGGSSAVGALLSGGASTRGGACSGQAAAALLPASAAVGGGSASPLLPAGGTAALSGGGPAGEAAPDEAAERAALVHFLQHERDVDELVEAMAL